jgi:hypothetical protein
MGPNAQLTEMALKFPSDQSYATANARNLLRMSWLDKTGPKAPLIAPPVGP